MNVEDGIHREVIEFVNQKTEDIKVFSHYVILIK